LRKILGAPPSREKLAHITAHWRTFITPRRSPSARKTRLIARVKTVGWESVALEAKAGGDRDIFVCHGGMLAQNEDEVLPRYGLYSTYAIIFGGILPISAFCQNGTGKSRNLSTDAFDNADEGGGSEMGSLARRGKRTRFCADNGVKRLYFGKQ